MEDQVNCRNGVVALDLQLPDEYAPCRLCVTSLALAFTRFLLTHLRKG
jgi:hypothetical protein